MANVDSKFMKLWVQYFLPIFSVLCVYLAYCHHKYLCMYYLYCNKVSTNFLGKIVCISYEIIVLKTKGQLFIRLYLVNLKEAISISPFHGQNRCTYLCCTYAEVTA